MDFQDVRAEPAVKWIRRSARPAIAVCRSSGSKSMTATSPLGVCWIQTDWREIPRRSRDQQVESKWVDRDQPLPELPLLVHGTVTVGCSPTRYESYWCISRGAVQSRTAAA